MNTRLILDFCWRYLRHGKFDKIISVTSWISICGIALGIVTIIIVNAVMNGFKDDITQHLSKDDPWVTVAVRDDMPLLAWRGVADAAMHSNAISDIVLKTSTTALLTKEHVNVPAEIYVIADAYVKAGLVPQDPANALSAPYLGAYDMMISAELAEQLDLVFDSKALLILPYVQSSIAGVVPRVRNLRVAYILPPATTASAFFANKFILYVRLADAVKLLRTPNVIASIALKLPHTTTAKAVVQTLLQHKLTPEVMTHLVLADWRDRNMHILAALQKEQLVITIILGLIIAIATFNILSSLIMLVAEKNQDIAILRTLGATQRDIKQLFCTLGLMISAMAMLVGSIMGIFLAHNIATIADTIETLLGQPVITQYTFHVLRLPSRIDFGQIVLIDMLTIVATVLVILYPAMRASKVAPSELLRYK